MNGAVLQVGAGKGPWQVHHDLSGSVRRNWPSEEKGQECVRVSVRAGGCAAKKTGPSSHQVLRCTEPAGTSRECGGRRGERVPGSGGSGATSRPVLTASLTSRSTLYPQCGERGAKKGDAMAGSRVSEDHSVKTRNRPNWKLSEAGDHGDSIVWTR